MAITETKKQDHEGLIEPKVGRDGWENRRHVARLVLVVFLITFTVIRILIFLIMSRTLPDMFVYIGGTHVHHLNLGIFLLSAVGGYLLFVRPKGRMAEWTAVLYGIGLALTFDEFGMWLHLGGGYWQRASFDAVTVVVGFLVLMAFGPSVKEIREKHTITILILLLLSAGFFFLLFQTVNKYGGKVHPRMKKVGQTQAPFQSQSEAASGTAARSESVIASRGHVFRQMPQP
ncbi:MAG: hypothetical protein NT006_00790 [Candidatus Aminicenantes bacterium]|nr:hypothetical protein [Candidatus Aminicenantes bacterium]